MRLQTPNQWEWPSSTILHTSWDRDWPIAARLGLERNNALNQARLESRRGAALQGPNNQHGLDRATWGGQVNLGVLSSHPAAGPSTHFKFIFILMSRSPPRR